MGRTVGTGGMGSEPTATIDAADLLEGQMVGEYRILGPLGQGGMGRVYSAEHPVIAKKAAIKVLHPELSVNKEAVDRFVQEARSVNQIGHPNIVDIFSFGSLPDGRNYFVMEWLRGESLRDRLKRQPLTITDALAILETISLPLEAAHEKGIVHRDLKPDNVFLVDVRDERPIVKLLDFGIAKLMGDRGGLQRTQTGNMLGTPAYISPEQARAEGVDHRTDIYALGAMAFELLTGKMVFAATNAADMIAQHLYQEPRAASSLNPQVPPQLDALLKRMLAKDANDRPTLAQVRAELRAIRMQLGGVLTPAHGTHLPHTPPHGVQMTPSGMYTPYPPHSMPPHQSMPPQHHSMPPQHQSMPPMAVAPAPTMPSAPVRKSKLPFVVALLLVLGGIGAAVIVMNSKQDQPAETSPAPAPVEMKATPVETAPVEPKPAEAKPAETPAAEIKPAEVTKPAAETTATETTKSTERKRKRTRTKTGTGSGATKPFDPDAPM